MTLNELLQNTNELKDWLLNDEEIIEEMENLIIKNSLDIKNKVDNYCEVIKYSQKDIEFYKEQEEKAKRKRKSIENKINWLKSQLLNALNILELKKIKGKMYSINIGTSEKVNILDEKEFLNNCNYSNYWKTKKEIDKSALKKALKNNSFQDTIAEIQKTNFIKII